MIGTKFNARITYIGNCLGALRAARPKVHTVNETPTTSIDGTALRDKTINKLRILKNIIK